MCPDVVVCGLVSDVASTCGSLLGLHACHGLVHASRCIADSALRAILLGCRRPQPSQAHDEAACLDMGNYLLPDGLTAASSGRRTIAVPGGPSRSHPAPAPGPGPGTFMPVPGPLSFWTRALWGPARVACQEGGQAEQLRLFQLLAPALAGRAMAFGNRVRGAIACDDMPYFDAPGALVAPLGPVMYGPVPELPQVGGGQPCCSGLGVCMDSIQALEFAIHDSLAHALCVHGTTSIASLAHRRLQLWLCGMPPQICIYQASAAAAAACST